MADAAEATERTAEAVLTGFGALARRLEAAEQAALWHGNVVGGTEGQVCIKGAFVAVGGIGANLGSACVRWRAIMAGPGRAGWTGP
jgi:hypothetical protein